ncbi:MAG TPA: hypothetical protein VLL54_03480 [Pyrinomonadaceae bacterium]|nr:hypothetical protein [Pyrinomonadaceae bacterium]
MFRVLMMEKAVLVMLLVALCGAVSAQEPPAPDEGAPPPLKVISRQERNQLDTTKDEKARVKLTIELAESHLTNVENKTSQQNFDVAAAEAGMYWALLEDALKYMKSVERDNNKKRDLYKRLELALRAHGPRLSGIRRNTPNEYAVWIREIEEFARRGRTEALNSFYGQTVLRESTPKPVEAKDQKKPPDKN